MFIALTGEMGQHNLKAINDTISQSTGYAVPSHTWDDAGEFLYQDLQSGNFAKRGVCEVHVVLREGEGIRVPLCVDGLDVHRILEEHGARRVDSVNVQVVPKFLRFVVVLVSSPDPRLSLREQLCADRWFRRGWTS